MSAIKCEIAEKNRVIEVITKETKTDVSDMIITLENFRRTVNETLTKLIEDNGEIDDLINDEASSDDESDSVHVSPKKRKK